MIYINAAQWIETYVTDHNKRHSDNPEMQYETFMDSDSSMDRNIRAKNRIETLLRLGIETEYGKLTCNQYRNLQWNNANDPLTEIASDPSLKIFLRQRTSGLFEN